MTRRIIGLFSERQRYHLLAVALLFMPLPSGAMAAGVNQACGGPTHIKCDGNLWCAHKPHSCGKPDAEGTCTKIDDPLCDAMFIPVCGCDKKDYGNFCDYRGKVQIDHPGYCQ